MDIASTVTVVARNKVRTLRALRNWSCEDLAREAGVSVNTIYQAEAMQVQRLPLRPRSVRKIAEGLGVDGEELAYLCLPVAWIPSSMWAMSARVVEQALK